MSRQFIKISEFRRWLETIDQSKELVFCDYYGKPITVNEYQMGIEVEDDGEAGEYCARVILDIAWRDEEVFYPPEEDQQESEG